jgi:16S rRNA (guanine527-N7)-methyltransferase
MSVDDEGLGVLSEGAARLGIQLDTMQLAAFARYRQLLLDWNTRMNLTAITAPLEVLIRHFLDSLTCLLALPPIMCRQSLRLLDVGSGAGFPGLALAIACPQWRVTTLEATGKKVDFQQTVIRTLGLTNVTAYAGRAEDLAHQPPHRGAYDVVTARALAALPTVLEYGAPFIRVGGRLIAPKKGDLAQELAQGARVAPLLGAQLLAPIAVSLPLLDDGRVVIVAQQSRLCPPRYPRAQGAPVKRPLGT